MKKLALIAGWLALTTGFISLLLYIVLPDLKILSASLAVVCLINTVYFGIAEGPKLKRSLSSRSALYGANTLALTAIFMGILIFANLLTIRHKHRFDFTEGGYFTLAPQTKKLVSSLPREVKLTAFFQTESPEKIAFTNLIAGYLEETDKIKLQYVDPDKNPAVTNQYGVTTYGTVTLESGTRETRIQNASEESITNALLKVTRDEQKLIYFLEGHNESKISNDDNLGYSTAKKNLEQDGFIVKPLLLLKSGEVPKDASVLVIPGPKKPLQDEEKEIIENYLNSGGAVFLLIDPKSSSGMETFLKKWGIEPGDNVVIDPMSKLFGGDFAAPVVNQYTAHEITNNFALATIFPTISSVQGVPVAGITTTELLKTSANSWAESDFNSETVDYNEDRDIKGPVSVSVIATKILGETNPGISDHGISDHGISDHGISDHEISNHETSDHEISDPEIFDPEISDAKVSDPETSDTLKSAAEHEKNKPSLKATLLVIGDSDFSNNRYTNFSGNGDFFLNAVSWLAEEEQLISIRPKERKNTPIQMTQSIGSTIFIMGIIVFPGLIAAMGIRIWWRRRRL